ncbi:hypothetical protein AVEN_76594-1, partial [Araneus ventricosus]
RGGLVVRSRPRGQRVPSAKPDSTEEPPCNWVWCTLNPSVPTILPLCGAEGWRGGASSGVVLVIRPRLKMTRSVPKALVLLHNGTLI